MLPVRGYAGATSNQPSGPQSIESTETVTVHIKEMPEQTTARRMREAEAGKAESQWNLGRLHNTGGLGAVQLDEAKAALTYGEMLSNGKGATANTVEAGKWSRTAVEKGIPKAMYLWGMLLEMGRDTTQDAQAAYRWFKKAADCGETRAYNNLGDLYSDGRGVAANAAEAANWYRKAWKRARQLPGDLYPGQRWSPDGHLEQRQCFGSAVTGAQMSVRFLNRSQENCHDRTTWLEGGAPAG